LKKNVPKSYKAFKGSLNARKAALLEANLNGFWAKAAKARQNSNIALKSRKN
jgi:hypothetical protein